MSIQHYAAMFFKHQPMSILYVLISFQQNVIHVSTFIQHHAHDGHDVHHAHHAHHVSMHDAHHVHDLHHAHDIHHVHDAHHHRVHDALLR